MVSLALAMAILAADLHTDGVIDSRDLAAVLSQWGQHGQADISGDGVVDSHDLMMVLFLWGAGWGAHSTGDGASWFVAPGNVISLGPSPFAGFRRLTFWDQHGDIAAIDMLPN